MSILEIDHLSKSFGANQVLNQISLTVPEKTIFGFIGQNGAGKTTTMKIILGLLKPDAGTIRVCGETVRYGQTKTNRHIGYLPDVPEFYGYMTPREYLRLCGEITGLPGPVIKKRSAELISLVGLEKANRRIAGFSRGMKQRLGIAQALINQPSLLICDEPTSALDPVGRKELLDILEQVKGQTTVLFSTHILSDVERICDRIALLNKGQIALCGTIAELKAQHRQDGLAVEFATTAEGQVFVTELRRRDGRLKIDIDGGKIVMRTADVRWAAQTAIDILAQQQLLPVKLEMLEPSMETLFLEVVQ